MKEKIEDLELLISAYRSGMLEEEYHSQAFHKFRKPSDNLKSDGFSFINAFSDNIYLQDLLM